MKKIYEKSNVIKAGNPKKNVGKTQLRMREPKGSTLPTFCTTTLTRIIQSLYYALLYPAIVPIEGAVLFELLLF
jgi:hypothetical protein